VSGVAQLYKGRLQLGGQEVELLKATRPTWSTPAGSPVTAPPRHHDTHESASSCTAPSSGSDDPRPPAPEIVEGEAPDLVRRGDPPDPLPGDELGASRRPAAAQVRRAVHARARGAFRKARVEAAPTGVSARALGHSWSVSSPPAVPSHERADPRDGRDRRGDGPPPADGTSCSGRLGSARRSWRSTQRSSRSDPVTQAAIMAPTEGLAATFPLDGAPSWAVRSDPVLSSATRRRGPQGALSGEGLSRRRASPMRSSRRR